MFSDSFDLELFAITLEKETIVSNIVTIHLSVRCAHNII